MSLIEPILTEFKLESANTRKALERVPENRFDWKPHEKSWTLVQLASHLAEIPVWLGSILETDEMDVTAQGDYQPFRAQDRQQLLDTFDRNVKQAVELMKKAPTEKLGKTWRIRSGDDVLWEAPRIGVIKSMLINHAIQHRGQLTVYLRLNDVPVPSIYGPSADEPGF